MFFVAFEQLIKKVFPIEHRTLPSEPPINSVGNEAISINPLTGHDVKNQD